jgi:hypothetical protein
MHLIPIFINNINILINYSKYFFISFFISLFFVNSLYVTFAETDLNNITESDKNKPTKISSIEDEYWFPIVKDVIVPLIIGIFGIASAGLIVNKWQKKKDISSIRSQVLSDFQGSHKDYIVMMDTFVAKILLKCYTIDNSKLPTQKKLTDLLPFGYDVGAAKDKIENHIFQFSNIQQHKDYIEKEFDTFEKDFFSRRKLVTKFFSGLRQYFKNGTNLNSELDALWEEKIMYAHILILNMMRSINNEQDFIDSLEKFKECIQKAFEDIKHYDYILSEAEIEI